MTIGCQLKGHYSRVIEITTNDPSHPKEALICRGQVLAPIRVSAEPLLFGQVSRTMPPQTKKVVVTRGDGGPLNPKLLPITAPGMRAELREIEPGERYEVEVTLTPPFDSVQVSKGVTLETGVAEVPTAVILVQATLRPRVLAEPNRFTVPREREGVWEESVRLVWDDTAPHKIIEVTVNDPKLTVRVAEADGQQRVVLQVPPDYAPAQSARSVTITTDDTEAPALRVPVVVPRDAKTRP